MSSLKKKFLIGMIGGAVLFSFGIGSYKFLADNHIELGTTIKQMISFKQMSTDCIAGKTFQASNIEFDDDE
ncbi:MAG: hypothetical protein IJ728_10900 [Selenomonadaceae bacterium]|nr:hypothetical protein [Selenomonadaceae bacterium]